MKTFDLLQNVDSLIMFEVKSLRGKSITGDFRFMYCKTWTGSSSLFVRGIFIYIIRAHVVAFFTWFAMTLVFYNKQRSYYISLSLD